MKPFLATSEYIDWQHPAVQNQAAELAEGQVATIEIARRCYEFVRDGIRHSYDFKLNPVTCRASDVLLQQTGYCYAQSHLLAALLRANDIPAGLCYQRLTIDDEKASYCLHGLNAVFLAEIGWYRIDARGNREGLEAAFSPPVEKLAFTIGSPGEADLPEIWSEPLPVVCDVLQRCQNYQEVYESLPDVPVLDNLLRPVGL